MNHPPDNQLERVQHNKAFYKQRAIVEELAGLGLHGDELKCAIRDRLKDFAKLAGADIWYVYGVPVYLQQIYKAVNLEALARSKGLTN